MYLGLPRLVLFPFLPLILRYVDSRVVCDVGILLFAASCLLNATTMTHDSGIDQLKWSQLIRALGQPLLMSPLSRMATIGIAPAQAGSASALFNMMRNLGGSVGIALLSTLTQTREHFRFSVIAERVTQNNALTARRLAEMRSGLDPHGAAPAPMRALRMLAAMVRQEAFVMAYADCFFTIGAALGVSVLLVGLLSRTRPGGARGEAH